jgi:hypothetical protein
VAALREAERGGAAGGAPADDEYVDLLHVGRRRAGP